MGKNQFSFRTSIVESAKILLSVNELMEEYRSIFSSKIFFLNYDELILNPEQEIKSLVSWLGWEYEKKYLHQLGFAFIYKYNPSSINI